MCKSKSQERRRKMIFFVRNDEEMRNQRVCLPARKSRAAVRSPDLPMKAKHVRSRLGLCRDCSSAGRAAAGNGKGHRLGRAEEAGGGNRYDGICCGISGLLRGRCGACEFPGLHRAAWKDGGRTKEGSFSPGDFSCRSYGFWKRSEMSTGRSGKRLSEAYVRFLKKKAFAEAKAMRHRWMRGRLAYAGAMPRAGGNGCGSFRRGRLGTHAQLCIFPGVSAAYARCGGKQTVRSPKPQIRSGAVKRWMRFTAPQKCRSGFRHF